MKWPLAKAAVISPIINAPFISMTRVFMGKAISLFKGTITYKAMEAEAYSIISRKEVLILTRFSFA